MGRGELDGVAHHVGDGPLQTVPVPGHGPRTVRVRVDGHLARRGLGNEIGDHPGHALCEVQHTVARRAVLLVLVQLVDQQQVLNQQPQPFRVAPHHFQHAGLFRADTAEVPVLEHLHIAADGRERGSQLVVGGGDEHGFLAVELRELLQGALPLLHHVPGLAGEGVEGRGEAHHFKSAVGGFRDGVVIARALPRHRALQREQRRPEGAVRAAQGEERHRDRQHRGSHHGGRGQGHGPVQIRSALLPQAGGVRPDVLQCAEGPVHGGCRSGQVQRSPRGVPPWFPGEAEPRVHGLVQGPQLRQPPGRHLTQDVLGCSEVRSGLSVLPRESLVSADRVAARGRLGAQQRGLHLVRGIHQGCDGGARGGHVQLHRVQSPQCGGAGEEQCEAQQGEHLQEDGAHPAVADTVPHAGHCREAGAHPSTSVKPERVMVPHCWRRPSREATQPSMRHHAVS